MPGTTWPTTSGAPPLFATPRNPAAWSEGPQVGAVGRALGTPLIPWQQYVADVAGEMREDGSYEHQVVIVSVPRQTGKTTLIRAVGTYRALVARRDVFYTAQTGKDARERWMDLVKMLRVNPALQDRVSIGLRGGSEQITFPGGSAFRVFAPTPESLHGYTPPTVMLDEAFALDAGKGELLMGAIGPAQITVTDKQIWIVSTAGTAESTFLHDWIDRAMGGMARVALFLWGADADADPYSPEGVAAFHPGIGFALNGKTLTPADVLEQVDRNTRAEYERAYANRRTLTLSHLVPPETWAALGPQDGVVPELPDWDDVTVSYDVAADRSAAAVVATWQQHGRVVSRLLASAPGLTWVADAIDRLPDRPGSLVAVDHGPVLEVTDLLRRRGHDVTTLGEREYATASGHLLTLIETAGLHHDGTEPLARSVTGLVTRAGAVDGVAFSRRHSVGDSSPGIALAVGAWHAGRTEHAAPLIDFRKPA